LGYGGGEQSAVNTLDTISESIYVYLQFTEQKQRCWCVRTGNHRITR